MQQPPIWVVIPAAGVGKRMQADRPKQYLSLLGKTVIEHTLDCFLHHPDITGIVIALHRNDPYWQDLSIRNSNDKPIYTVIGGKERSDSVLNALHYLSNQQQCAAHSWVMVHDAARPCLSSHDIDQLIELVKVDDPLGGILASPVKDTMKRATTLLSEKTAAIDATPIQISKTESRENLYHALTPQMFRLAALQQAVQFAFDNNIAITDDASAMEQQGLSPRLIIGDANNIKITQASDLALAEFFLSQRGQSL